MTTSVFEVDGQDYRCNLMNAFEQLEVARLLRDPLASLAVVEASIREKQPEGGKQLMEYNPHTFAQVIAVTSGGLSRTEVSEAVSTCLQTVERRQGQNWAPIKTAGTVRPHLNFTDIQISQMLEIVWHVLKLNGLIDFFAVSPSGGAMTTESQIVPIGSASRTG